MAKGKGPVLQEDSIADFLPFQMRRFLARWDVVETDELQPLALTRLQFWTLLAVVQSGDVTVSEIAGILRVDQTTISRTLDALVRRRLLDRKISSTDLRQRVISVRPEGEALAAEGWARLRNRMSTIDGMLSPALRERGLKMARALADAEWSETPAQP